MRSTCIAVHPYALFYKIVWLYRKEEHLAVEELKALSRNHVEIRRVAVHVFML